MGTTRSAGPESQSIFEGQYLARDDKASSYGDRAIVGEAMSTRKPKLKTRSSDNGDRVFGMRSGSRPGTRIRDNNHCTTGIEKKLTSGFARDTLGADTKLFVFYKTFCKLLPVYSSRPCAAEPPNRVRTGR